MNMRLLQESRWTLRGVHHQCEMKGRYQDYRERWCPDQNRSTEFTDSVCKPMAPLKTSVWKASEKQLSSALFLKGLSSESQK